MKYRLLPALFCIVTLFYSCEHPSSPKEPVVPSSLIAPSSLIVEPGVASLKLYWSESDQADHYEIWYKKNNVLQEGYRLYGYFTGTSARITELTCGVSHDFRMRAVSSDAKSDYAYFPSATPEFGIIYQYAESRTQMTYRETSGTYNEIIPVESAPDNLYYPLIRDDVYQMFLGWNTQPDGSGKGYVPDEQVVLSQPITLYAQLTTDDSVCGKKGPAGGIVCYDAGSMQSWGRYIEAAPFSEIYAGIWGDVDWGLLGTDTAIGSGKTNTELITDKAAETGMTTTMTYMPDAVTQMGERPISALVCGDLVINHYDDWFLPSRDEMNAVLSHLPSIGITMFYGSSSEKDENQAYYFEVDTGANDYLPKTKDALIDIGLSGIYVIPRLLPVRYF